MNTSNESNDVNCLNNSNNNGKKINKLIWNEEKLEVEYRDKEEEEAAAAAEAAAEKQQVANNAATSALFVSPNANLKRQSSGINLDVSIWILA